MDVESKQVYELYVVIYVTISVGRQGPDIERKSISFGILGVHAPKVINDRKHGESAQAQSDLHSRQTSTFPPLVLGLVAELFQRVHNYDLEMPLHYHHRHIRCVAQMVHRETLYA